MQRLYLSNMSKEEKMTVAKKNDNMMNKARELYSQDMIELVSDDMESIVPYLKKWSFGFFDRNNYIEPDLTDMGVIEDFLNELIDSESKAFYSDELIQTIHNITESVEDYQSVEDLNDEACTEYVLDKTNEMMDEIYNDVENEVYKICDEIIATYKAIENDILDDDVVSEFVADTGIMNDVYIMVNEDNVYHYGIDDENLNAYRDINYTIDMNDGVHYHD